MAEAWRVRHLGDLIDLYDNRRVPLSGLQRRERHGPFPYYGASGVIDYVDDFRFDGRFLLISEDGENLRSRKSPIAFFAHGKFWVNNHAHVIKAKKGEAIAEFLLAWIASADLSGSITGAAQPKLSQDSLKRISLLCPPLPIQRKIAAVLATYDDLIENNRQRVAVLEESLDLIYEHRLMSGVELSPRRTLVGDVLTLEYGKALPARERNVGPVRVLSSAGSVGWHDCSVYSGPGVVVGRKGNVGSVHWVDEPHWVIDTAYSVSSDLPKEFLYFALRRLEFKNTHAAVPGLNREDVYSQWFNLPSDDALAEFVRVARASFAARKSMIDSIRNLEAQRGLLLPKLISGELNIEDCDIDTSRVEAQDAVGQVASPSKELSE